MSSELSPEQAHAVAQELAREAIAIPELGTRARLARLVLQIDVDCPEAYLALATTEEDPERARPLLERAVSAAESHIEEGLDSHRGSLWEIPYGDSYLVARQLLGANHWSSGDIDAGVSHYREVLVLGGQEYDSLGVSETLAAHLIARGEDSEAALLMDQYPSDSTQQLYSRALLAFKRFGAADSRANHELQKALESNPYVPDYLRGLRPLPSEPLEPSDLVLSNWNAAKVYALSQSEAWSATSGAVEWLSRYTDPGPLSSEPN